MSLDADVRRLAGARPLDQLSREALQVLTFSCQKRNLRQGEPLFRAGEPADGAFFVFEGEILLRKHDTERRAGVGVLIGERALLADTVRPADATAARDCVLLAIPRETFRRVLSEFPADAKKLHRTQLARTRELVAALDGVKRRGFAPQP